MDGLCTTEIRGWNATDSHSENPSRFVIAADVHSQNDMLSHTSKHAYSSPQNCTKTVNRSFRNDLRSLLKIAEDDNLSLKDLTVKSSKVH